MSIQFPRKKGRNFLLSFFYKFDKVLPFPKKLKLKLYLDLEWIFERLAHEQSFKVFGKEFHPVRHRSVEFLLKHLTAEDKVMDLGCNSGDLTFILSRNVKDITGIDHDEKLIEEARRKYQNISIKFIKDDATSFLQQNNQRFDVLVLSHIIEHLDNPVQFLQLAKKYFQHVYIEVPDLDRSNLNVYREAVKSPLRYSDADHIWEFDREDMQKLIVESGLTIEDQEYKWGAQKYWCAVS